MAGFIPDQILEQILDRCDIAEVISGYIPLKRAGRNYKALCPFHHEKTPSFMINPEKGIFHCFGCFPAGSLIKTEMGFHKIEEVQAGQSVLTHRGRFMPVIRTLWRPYNGKVVDVYTRKSNVPVTLTADHEVFVIKTKNCKYASRKNKICQWRCKLNCREKFFNKYRIEKLPSRQLSINDYLLHPINQEITDIAVLDIDKYYDRKVSNFRPKIKAVPAKVRVDDKFLKLIGYWIAEGSNHRAYIRFSLGHHEEKFAREITELVQTVFHIKASIHIRKKIGKRGIEITARSSELSNIFQNLCGKGAENKHIPFEFQTLPLRQQEIILNAVFRGDGRIGKVAKCREDRKFKSITTISLVLAEQLKDILLRRGISPTLRLEKAKADKRNTKHKTSYRISWQENFKQHFSDIRPIDNGLYQMVPVRKIVKKGFIGEVYNLTVAEDHSYTTPNFVVGNCGVGGNVFSFIMKHERLEFPEVVTMLAKKTGVALPERGGQESRRSASENDAMYRIHEFATAFFQHTLLSDAGARTRDYLAKRGVSNDSARKFRLGLAPNSRDSLFRYLKSKGFTDGLIAKTGLIIHRPETSTYYDRFRNRLIFPIFNQRDRVVAFGGRVLDDSQPKYMNSPETSIYHKSRTLFGFNFAKKHISEKDAAVVVEGYLDFLIPFQSGLKNIVASCGTALTIDHAKLLKRFTGNIIMVYDPDKAGEAATLRGLEILLPEDMDIGILRLPAGHDPDSFVRTHGIEAFQKIKPVGLLEYKIGILTALHGRDSAQAKAKVAGEMLKTIAKVNNAIVKSEYLKKLADVVGVREESLREELKKVKRQYEGSYHPQPADSYKSRSHSLSQAEKILIGLMIEDNRLIGTVKEQLGSNGFVSGSARKIAGFIFNADDGNRPVSYSTVMNNLAVDGLDDLLSEIATTHAKFSDRKRNLEDCISWIKKNGLKKDLNELHDRIKEAQRGGEHQKMSELVVRYNKLVKECARHGNCGKPKA